MKIDKLKQISRKRRKIGIRKRVLGTPERPRLSVHRSNKHIYAQVIDDARGVTVASASTLEKDVRASLKSGATREATEEKQSGALPCQEQDVVSYPVLAAPSHSAVSSKTRYQRRPSCSSRCTANQQRRALTAWAPGPPPCR